MRALTGRIAGRAAPAYLMGVAGNADPMLGYLTTSFREHAPLRRRTGRDMTPAMRQRLERLGAIADGQTRPGVDTVARLSAAYARAGGDRRPLAALEDEARRALRDLQERGWDLGVTDAGTAHARIDALYRHAREALYATIDEAVIRDATVQPLVVHTEAASRDGSWPRRPWESACETDARAVDRLYPRRRPQVQIVVSDGLNANALNEQLRGMLPGVRHALAAAGHHVGERDVVVRNGRVRAGYDVGGRAGADVVVHFIGERPGTGLNTLSAYVTYGRDAVGAPRWSRDLPHSVTTAVCGIHQRGKPPEAAIGEIARIVGRAFSQRRSGAWSSTRAADGNDPRLLQTCKTPRGRRHATISAVAVAAGCLGRLVPLEPIS